MNANDGLNCAVRHKQRSTEHRVVKMLVETQFNLPNSVP